MNALISRVSAPLAVCLVGAAIAGLSLLRSPQPTAAPPAPAATPTTVAADPADDPGGDVPAEDTPAEPVAARLDIAGFAFSGAETVAPGQAITIANADGTPHTVTSVDGAFDTGLIDGGGSGELTAPTAPGTYAYFCSLHPSMTGTLVVS